MPWIEIDTGVWAKEGINPTEVVILSDLQDTIDNLSTERATVDVPFTHANKDYEAWVNDNRRHQVDKLTERISAIQSIVDEING